MYTYQIKTAFVWIELERDNKGTKKNSKMMINDREFRIICGRKCLATFLAVSFCISQFSFRLISALFPLWASFDKRYFLLEFLPIGARSDLLLKKGSRTVSFDIKHFPVFSLVSVLGFVLRPPFQRIKKFCACKNICLAKLALDEWWHTDFLAPLLYSCVECYSNQKANS